jgi:hypothetical protein
MYFIETHERCIYAICISDVLGFCRIDYSAFRRGRFGIFDIIGALLSFKLNSSTNLSSP